MPCLTPNACKLYLPGVLIPLNTNVNTKHLSTVDFMEMRYREEIPEWFKDSISLSIRILKANQFRDFKCIEQFLTASVSDFTCEEEERKKGWVRHIRVKVLNKGIKGKFQYITLCVRLIGKEKAVEVCTSCKVKLQDLITKD